MATKTQPPPRRTNVNDDPLHRIMTTKSAHVEVPAVPGAGKTFACVSRVRALIDQGVPGRRLVIISFSNAAVEKLRARVAALASSLTQSGEKASAVATNLNAVTITTAHALANRLGGGGELLSAPAAKRLLGRAITDLLKRARARDVWSKLSPAKREQRVELLKGLRESSMLPAVLELFAYAAAADQPVRDVTARPRFEALAGFFAILPLLHRRWMEIKRRDRVIDFADMLGRARTAIGSNPKLLPFDHILVDEYQDGSSSQAQLMAAMASLPRRSVMVFGDPGQAIFGFAGGQYSPLSELFDDVEVIRLPESRRLTAETAALASAVAGHRRSQAIRATRGGGRPLLVTSADELSQAGRIARDVRSLIAKGVPAQEIAVLARVRALLHPVEMALLADGVLTKRLGGGAKRNRKHAVRVLRLVQVVEECAREKRKPLAPRLRRQFKALANEVAIERWVALAADLRKATRVESLEGRYILAAKAYVRLLGGARSAAGKMVRDDVNRWAPLCRKYQTASEMRAAVLSFDRDAVMTSTIHAAKGAEWRHVLIVGATDGIMPWHQSAHDLAEAEERNLLYVAITRARDSIRLYHAPCVHARSRKVFTDVSRFLEAKRVRAHMGQRVRPRSQPRRAASAATAQIGVFTRSVG